MLSAASYSDSYQLRGRDFCFVSIDVQGMKKINDVLGRNLGNHVLIAVAKRLERTVGVQGVVARLGGDNFGIIFQAPDMHAAAIEVKRIAEMTDTTAMEIDGLEVDIFLAMGWALYSEERDVGAMMMLATDRRLGRVPYPDNVRFEM